MIRKFFTTDAGEGGGGAEEIVVGKTFSLSDMQPAPAAEETNDDQSQSQSSDGQSGDGDNGDNQESQSQNDQQQTGDDTNNSDSSQEQSQDQQQNADQHQQQELTLDEVLKGKDKKEVLKALGVSEEVFDALDTAQSLDDLKKYLDVRTRNIDAIPAEQILRENLRQEYADLDEAKFEKVFKAEMKKYSLDSLDDDEKELGEIRLERDAAKIRTQLKAEQAQFKLPEPKPSTEAQRLQEIEATQKKQKEEYDSFVTMIKGDAEVKKLMQDKRLVVADGVNFEVAKPEELLNALVDTRNIFAGCVKADGSYDIQKALKIVNYALNMEAYDAAVTENAKSKVNLETLEELQNSNRESSGGASGENETLAGAFGSRGVSTSLGSILGR